MLKRHIINEARVQRTIDPKIWASMSSMSSRLRDTLGEDARAKSTDSKEVLLQKYVAGLLTMKSQCPETESDIERLKAYKKIGQAFINKGGTMAEIQKLYVENGGTIDFEISSGKDFPSYEEADRDDSQSIQNTEPEFPSYEEADRDDIGVQRPIDTQAFGIEQDLDDQILMSDNDSLDDEEPQEDPIANYFKTLFYKVNKARPGQFITWDSQEGIILSDNEDSALGTCVAYMTRFTDGKPRFLLKGYGETEIGTPGNGGAYNDYYFRATLNRGTGHYDVIPGNNYHHKEANNGPQYTGSLLKNGNNAASEVKAIVDSVVRRLNTTAPELTELTQYISENAYLPTLPELVYAVPYLEPGMYWTSSVTDNGMSNIIYEISKEGDRFIKGDSPSDVAKVVAFIKF